jgi:hypothetical protein
MDAGRQLSFKGDNMTDREVEIVNKNLQLARDLALEAAADVAEHWGGAPPSPAGRRAALAAYIRGMKGIEFQQDNEIYEMDQRNIGSDITANKLKEIIETGEHTGVFGGAPIEQAAQAILSVHVEVRRLRRELADCKSCAKVAAEIAADVAVRIVAQILHSVATTGNHPGGPRMAPHIEAAAQGILNLHREKEHYKDRVTLAYPGDTFFPYGDNTPNAL